MILLSEKRRKNSFFFKLSLKPKGIFPCVESALVGEVATRWVWLGHKLIFHKDLGQL